MDALTVLMDLALSAACFGAGALAGRKAKKQPNDEPRCTGYRFGRGAVNMMRDDCTALRSQLCKDGRCSYHCGQMCQCEEVFK